MPPLFWTYQTKQTKMEKKVQLSLGQKTPNSYSSKTALKDTNNNIFVQMVATFI